MELAIGWVHWRRGLRSLYPCRLGATNGSKASVERLAGSTRSPRKVGLVRHTTCQPIRNDTTQIYWLAPQAPPLMPPAAAPPLPAPGPLIAPAPPSVSLPPLFPRLPPAAPA